MGHERHANYGMFLRSLWGMYPTIEGGAKRIVRIMPILSLVRRESGLLVVELRIPRRLGRR